MPSLPEFWVLKKRTKLRFSVDRIRSRELLPGAEQLLCAILRKDRNETALLMQRYEESAADFCALAEKNRFASLVADHLLEMDRPVPSWQEGFFPGSLPPLPAS